MKKPELSIGVVFVVLVALMMTLLMALYSGISNASERPRAQTAAAPQKEPHDNLNDSKSALDEVWVATLPPAKDTRPALCLARAIYFEARGEPIDGQLAVGNVVLNRVSSPAFPDTACAVIDQGVDTGRCQFSFRCSSLAADIKEEAAFDTAHKLAGFLLNTEGFDVTGGATHFHTKSISPSWSSKMEVALEIENHVFLKPKGVLQ